MPKVAILADPHLPDHPDTVKDDAFDWALATALEQQADVIVAIGDVTAVGTLAAARRVRHKLDATGLPCLIVPGNAEYRTPEDTVAVLQTLQTPVLFEKSGCQVVALDNSQQGLNDADRSTLHELQQKGAGRTLLAAHFPLNAFAPEDRTLVTELLESGCIDLFVAGHIHVDSVDHIGRGESHTVRGIDPDKAIGGPPALTFFEYDSVADRWCRSDAVWPAGCARSWTPGQRADFEAFLGMSCMTDSLGGITAAIEHRIQSIELRFESTIGLPRHELYDLVDQWRRQGGQNLSIHFPSIGWNRKARTVRGREQVKRASDLALELGANRLTLHVPRCPVGMVTEHADIRNQLLEAFADGLKDVLAAGLTVGIENMHMNPGEKPDAERSYGYTPQECLDWITALRERTGSTAIGFHFDNGHARNNAPYSSLYNISQWFAEMGALITGYHLHQVEMHCDGRFINHRPVTGMFGPLISFSSFFAAWNSKQINHAPVFLEVRDGGSLASLECVRSYLSPAQCGSDLALTGSPSS